MSTSLTLTWWVWLLMFVGARVLADGLGRLWHRWRKPKVTSQPLPYIYFTDLEKVVEFAEGGLYARAVAFRDDDGDAELRAAVAKLRALVDAGKGD